MKKINKKQKKIMRIGSTILFAIALILILNLVFNGSNNKIDKKIIGTWVIGYNFYEGNTKDNLLYSFIQELHISKDGTFYTKENKIPGTGENNYAQGTYETSNNKITFNYEQNGEQVSNILILKDNKLCLNDVCDIYYTLDKVEEYFPMYNSSITSEE